MKKKIIILLFIILVFLAFSYKYFLSDYYNFLWNSYYENDNYSWALINYNKSKELNQNYLNLYNIWNTYFKLSNKIDQDLLIKSLNSYSWSLNEKYTDEAKYNYDLVLDLLNKNKKSEEDSNSQDKQEENKESQEKTQNNEDNSSNDEENQNKDSWNEPLENQKWYENKDEQLEKNLNNYDNNEISNWEYQLLKLYRESIKDWESKYQDYYNKQDNYDLFESFFWWNNQKDW